MADARINWVAISRNGQFPVSPHTYKWLEKNTGHEDGYCTLREMNPSEWRIQSSARLWNAEGWLATENDSEAAQIVVRDFLKKLPNDRELILLFTTDPDFTYDPIGYPFVVRSLLNRADGSTNMLECMLPISSDSDGSQGFVEQRFNLTGRSGLATEASRAAMIVKLLAEGTIVAYVRRAMRITGRGSYGIPTST